MDVGQLLLEIWEPVLPRLWDWISQKSWEIVVENPRSDSSPDLQEKPPGSPGVTPVAGLEWDLSIPSIPNHSMLPCPLKLLLLQGAGNGG